MGNQYRNILKDISKEKLFNLVKSSINFSEVIRKLGFSNFKSGKALKRLKKRIEQDQIDISHFSKRRSQIWRMKKEDLVQIVKDSKNYGEILQHFGLKNIGGNKDTLEGRLKFDNIEFVPVKNKSNSRSYIRIPIEELLVENSNYCRGHLKKRLIEEGLLEYKCSKCNNVGEWLNKKLVLVLDHINGIRDDNRLKNLRFLCPNCNSQEETFCGKKTKNIVRCNRCGKLIGRGTICKNCYNTQREYKPHFNSRKVKRPYYNDLKKDISEMSFLAVGKKYGVSDNAIRKWVKYYEKELLI